MNVLITGGAGFIGSSVAERLLQLGHKVSIVDNYQTGVRQNNSPHANLTITEGSIADTSLVKKVFSEFVPNVVLHCAGSYKDPDNWLEDISTNISGTINIISASKTVKVKRLIYLQTSLSYGLHSKESPISVDHPLLSGGSSYAISKTTGELYLELSKLDFISFRLANVYGPRNFSGPLPTFFRRLSNDLPCTLVDTRRDFIFIDDVVSLLIKAIEGAGKTGAYNVATGKDHSIEELFNLTVKHIGKLNHKTEKRKCGTDDAVTILLDPCKTKKDFNWSPAIELEEGVKRTIAWYKSNPPSQTYTHLKNITQ